MRTEPTWSLRWLPGIWTRREVTAALLSLVVSMLMAVTPAVSEVCCWGSRSSCTELAGCSEAAICLPSQCFFPFLRPLAGEAEQNLMLGSSLRSIITNCLAKGLWAMMVISAT